LLLAAMFALAGPGPASAPHVGAVFQGRTSQGELVSFSVPKRRRLGELAVIVRSDCRSFLPSVAERRVFRGIPVYGAGSFTAVSREVPLGVFPFGDVAWIEGRFVTPRRARGTIVFLARRSDPALGVSSCTTRLRWTARAR